MPEALREAFEVVRLGKRNHNDLTMVHRDLPVELSRLRKMLLAEESTNVAQQDKDCRAPQQAPGVKDVSINRPQVEVQIDRHDGTNGLLSA